MGLLTHHEMGLLRRIGGSGDPPTPVIGIGSKGKQAGVGSTSTYAARMEGGHEPVYLHVALHDDK